MPYDYVDDLKVAGIALRAWGNSVTDMFVAAANGTVHTMAANLDDLDFPERYAFEKQAVSLDLLLADFLQAFIDRRHNEQMLMRPTEAILTQTHGTFKIRACAEGTRMVSNRRVRLHDGIKRVDPQRVEIVEGPEGWAATLVLEK